MAVWQTFRNFKSKLKHCTNSTTLLRFKRCCLGPACEVTTVRVCVHISWTMYHSSIKKIMFFIFYYNSLKSKPFLTLAIPITKLAYRMSVKFIFILFLSKSQTDLLLGLVLWFFPLAGSLICPLDVKWHSVSLWYFHYQLLHVKRKFYWISVIK
jgi:hypothetical protein